MDIHPIIRFINVSQLAKMKKKIYSLHVPAIFLFSFFFLFFFKVDVSCLKSSIILLKILFL